MTEHYAELAVAEPIFGELRNCMELAVVGALVARERLSERAGCSLPTLLDESAAQTVKLSVPKQVDSKASMLKKRPELDHQRLGRGGHPGDGDRRSEPAQHGPGGGPQQGRAHRFG